MTRKRKRILRPDEPAPERLDQRDYNQRRIGGSVVLFETAEEMRTDARRHPQETRDALLAWATRIESKARGL